MTGGRGGMSSSSFTPPRFSWVSCSATVFWLSSPTQGKLLLPVQARPKSRQKLSIKLSSSSTTTSRPTDLANSVIFFSGRGQTMPSFSTGYVSPQASFTYW